MKKNLVIGGVRSGKSRYAEQTAQEYATQLGLSGCLYCNR